MTEHQVETAATCAGCSAPLHQGPAGLMTCDTDGCWGNLIQRFPPSSPPGREPGHA